MTPRNSINTALKNYRDSHSLSEHELASLLGIGLDKYQSIENGSDIIPFDVLKKIFRKLNISELEL